jgi:hypothetical protein
MPFFDTINQVVRSYEWFDILIEIAVIWACVYLVVRFLKGTRGAGIVKGIAVALVVLTLLIKVGGRGTEYLGRLNFIYDRFLGLAAILLIVVFQPELRQFMIRLGHARFFRPSASQVHRVTEAVSEAVEMLSKNQFGALSTRAARAWTRRSAAACWARSSGPTAPCTTWAWSSAATGFWPRTCSSRWPRRDRSRACTAPATGRPWASPWKATAWRWW